MDIKNMLQKATALLYQYRYAACILLIGVVLMLLPTGHASEESTMPPENIPAEVSVEKQLSGLLSKIQGAGQVEVMLSYASGAETLYHSDRKDDTDSTQTTAVIITGSDRSESALVSRVDPPRYLGAVVVCQGADSAAVRLAVVEAVSKFTGLGADQIAVLKMK